LPLHIIVNKPCLHWQKVFEKMPAPVVVAVDAFAHWVTQQEIDTILFIDALPKEPRQVHPQ
jgi:hypothetical protein